MLCPETYAASINVQALENEATARWPARKSYS